MLFILIIQLSLHINLAEKLQNRLVEIESSGAIGPTTFLFLVLLNIEEMVFSP